LTDADILYSEDELRLLILDEVDHERRRFERLKARFDRREGTPEKHRREVIQEEVRVYVWKRDGGKCVVCAATRDWSTII